MAEAERFERWEPIDGLAPKMLIDGMYDDREGFRLILKSSDPKMRSLRILFDAPLCYRGAQEAYLLRQIYSENDIYPWPIFIVRNSRYAKWFYSQAADAIDKDGHHYHIAAMDRDYRCAFRAAADRNVVERRVSPSTTEGRKKPVNRHKKIAMRAPLGRSEPRRPMKLP